MFTRADATALRAASPMLVSAYVSAAAVVFAFTYYALFFGGG
jgi:hypothetical protein